jgi:hypothetical protein
MSSRGPIGLRPSRTSVYTMFNWADLREAYKFIGFGAMDATKPYKFIGFGAMDATKPSKFIGFGAMDATKPYNFLGFGPLGSFGPNFGPSLRPKPLQSRPRKPGPGDQSRS